MLTMSSNLVVAYSTRQVAPPFAVAMMADPLASDAPAQQRVADAQDTAVIAVRVAGPVRAFGGVGAFGAVRAFGAVGAVDAPAAGTAKAAMTTAAAISPPITQTRPATRRSPVWPDATALRRRRSFRS
jgi:hypothetical protein